MAANVENNDTPGTLAMGLLVVRVGFWFLVLGAIVPGIAVSEAVSQRRNIAEDSKFQMVAPLYLLPGSILDLIGRFLCCRLPSRWRMLRPYALTAALLPCTGIGLVSLVAVNRQFGYASIPDVAGLIGLLACVIGWISFVEFLRRLSRYVNDENLLWRAIAVMGLWMVCATMSVCIVLGVIPPVSVIGVAILGLLFLSLYETLLSRSRAAVLTATLHNHHPG